VKAFSLARDLATEQRAFLRRRRGVWQPHLERVRGFLGDGLRSADPGRPVLVLGAGSGLEVPWRLAPPGTVGWDADPWSRARTWLRHGRWAPWEFQDLTGGLGALSALAWRTARQPFTGQVRTSLASYRRLVGLLGTLQPQAAPLRAWIQQHRPGTILAANVMGQFGVVAQRAVERAFAGYPDGGEDPDGPDALEQAMDAWTARAVRAFLGALLDSGAELWLVHDRGVLFGTTPAELGPLREPWPAQLRAAPLHAGAPLEAMDPLCGVDVLAESRDRGPDRHQRWLWPVAEGQTHVMEALRIPPGSR